MADKKLNNLLSFQDHNDKYNKPAKKTKRTDVAKDILEKREEKAKNRRRKKR